MQCGYIILITGAAFLITGISVSAIWTTSFNPLGAVNAITQISDINHPLSLVIHLESNGNHPLRETVRDSNGQIISANEFSSILD
jgi:hypothetical protein